MRTRVQPNYIKHIPEPKSTVLQKKASEVTCIKNNDSMLFVGLDNGRVEIYHNDLTLAYSLIGHAESENKTVNDIRVLDGKTLATAGRDGTIKIWDIASGICKQTLTGPESAITELLACTHETIVSISNDSTARLWDLKTGECLVRQGRNEKQSQVMMNLAAQFPSLANYLTSEPVLKTTDDTYRSMTLLKNGDIACGSWFGIISIFDGKNFACKYEFKATEKQPEGLWFRNERAINGLVCLNNGDLVSGSNDGTVRIWDKDTFECKNKFSDCSRYELEPENSTTYPRMKCITEVMKAILKMNHYIVSFSNSTVRIFDTENNICVRTFSDMHDIFSISVTKEDLLITQKITYANETYLVVHALHIAFLLNCKQPGVSLKEIVAPRMANIHEQIKELKTKLIAKEHFEKGRMLLFAGHHKNKNLSPLATLPKDLIKEIGKQLKEEDWMPIKVGMK